MTDVTQRLRESLEELDQTVATMATANPKPNLLPLFERIDTLARTLPPGTDPSLMHYLQKRSYQKALLYLQGRDSENKTGSCGHV
jgi:hypothetical protein